MDRDLYLTVNALARQSPWLHGFMPPYALWGGLLALSLLLVGGWLWARRQPASARLVSTAVLTGVSVVTALVVNQHVISPAVARVRPCTAVTGAQVLLPCTTDYSMPSDHCIMAGAFAAGLWILNRRLGAVATILALLLAFGRVYTGMHYPSDVIAGLLVGAGITAAMVLCLNCPVSRLLQALPRPARTLIAGPRGTSSEVKPTQEVSP